MIYYENRYREIIFDKYEILQNKLREFIPKTGMVHSDAWFAMTGEHFNNNEEAFNKFMDIPEMQELLDAYGVKDYVVDFGVHATKPGGHFLGQLHIDELPPGQSPLRILVPVWGYEDSYTVLYKHLGKSGPIKTLTDFYGEDQANKDGIWYQYYTFEKDDVEFIDRIPTVNPWFFNHRQPHDVEHNGPNHRVIVWINLDQDFPVDRILNI